MIMKITILGTIFALSVCNGGLVAQKVGVNKSNPIATLDVAGSINTDSILTVKGQVGQEGQVLMAMGGNKMAWHTPDFPGADQFKYWRYYLSNGTFTIPEGVSRIFVEAWGGGGGGGLYLGGGSGGYAAGYFNVSAGQIITINIGQGGEGSSGIITNAADGENTTVTVLSNSISAQGGKGVVHSISGYLGGAQGGEYSFAGPATRMQFGANGMPGKARTMHIVANEATGEKQDITFGAGGNTPMWPAPTGGRPLQVLWLLQELIKIDGSPGYRPGGGGGSKDPPGSNISGGYAGGPGMVRIGY
jgi:hypothetical protein